MSILIDRHHGSSPHPHAFSFTETTVEHFRPVGSEDRILSVPANMRLRRAEVASLSGDRFEETVWTSGKPRDRTVDLSPYTSVAIARDKLEPILREAALQRGADR